MITFSTINNIFNKYTTLAANPEADICLDRNLHDLMMFAIESDFVDFDGDKLTFAQGGALIPELEIERICGAQDLGSHMAIIMPASVILVNKTNGKVNLFLPD